MYLLPNTTNESNLYDVGCSRFPDTHRKGDSEHNFDDSIKENEFLKKGVDRTLKMK